MLGDALLVAPVLRAQTTSVSVYFPGSEPWYDLESYNVHTGPTRKTIAAPLRKIPVFQRGGTIVPRKMRVRRSSSLTKDDPFTLYVALDSAVRTETLHVMISLMNLQGSASGILYADDYHTYDYQKGQYSLRKFSIFKSGTSFTFKSTFVTLRKS